MSTWETSSNVLHSISQYLICKYDTNNISRQVKCVESFLALRANPNAKNSDNQTPLHIAVQRYIQHTLDCIDEKKDSDP